MKVNSKISLILLTLLLCCRVFPDRVLNLEELQFEKSKEKVYIEDNLVVIGCSPSKSEENAGDYFSKIITGSVKNKLNNLGYRLVDKITDADLLIVIKIKQCYFLGDFPNELEQSAMDDAILKAAVAVGFLGLIPIVGGGNDGYFLTEVTDIRNKEKYDFSVSYHLKYLVSILTAPFIFFEFRESRITRALDPYLDLVVFYVINRKFIKNNLEKREVPVNKQLK